MASSSTEMAIFQRVAERGSFAGAAEDAGLSPSAVAKLITRLEQRLGVRLINRTTRRLALTAEGEIYLDRVHEILAAIEAAESEIASARVSPRGHLRVHTFPVIAAHQLAPALPDFLARYPHAVHSHCRRWVKNGGLARSRPHLRCPQHPSKRTLRDGFKGLFRAKAVIGSPSFDRLGMLHCSESGTQLAKGCAQW